MRLPIDRSGRIVVPKPLRTRLVLDHEHELELVERPDGVLLRPIRQQPSLIKVGGAWVHQGVAESDINWDKVVDDVREERIRDLLGPMWIESTHST